MWQVTAIVTLKEGVLDVQGRAVEAAMRQLGYRDVSDLKVGKYIEFSTQEEPDAKKLNEVGAELLANPVIEVIKFQVERLAT